MLGSMMGYNWTMGMIAHFVNGTVILPLIYAYLLFMFLTGTPWLKGVLWGMFLWLAQAAVMPILGGPFGSQRDEVMALVGSLISHIVYGAVLGGIAGGSAKK